MDLAEAIGMLMREVLMKIGNIEYPSLKGKVSDAEWRARVDLAAIYRLITLFGWWDMSQSPAGARIPGTDQYLFNPMGLLFEEITASSLVRISLDGKILSDTPFSILRGAWYPLEAVFAVREDANFVIHSHDRYAAALSARRDKLLPISQPANFALAEGVAYHDYDGVETYEDKMAPVQASLSDKNYLILHNHGMVTIGALAPMAFGRMENLRTACEIQLLAGQDRDLISVGEDVRPVFAEELRKGVVVDNLWPALLRKLDRLDPSYAD